MLTLQRTSKLALLVLCSMTLTAFSSKAPEEYIRKLEAASQERDAVGERCEKILSRAKEILAQAQDPRVAAQKNLVELEKTLGSDLSAFSQSQNSILVLDMPESAKEDERVHVLIVGSACPSLMTADQTFEYLIQAGATKKTPAKLRSAVRSDALGFVGALIINPVSTLTALQAQVTLKHLVESQLILKKHEAEISAIRADLDLVNEAVKKRIANRDNDDMERLIEDSQFELNAVEPARQKLLKLHREITTK